MEYAEMRRYQIVVRITTVLNDCQDDTVIISKPFFHQFGNRIQWFKLHIENSHPIRVFSVMVISLIMVIKMTALMAVNFTVLNAFFLQNLKSTTSHWIFYDSEFMTIMAIRTVNMAAFSELIFLRENWYLNNHSRDYVDFKCITNDSCARA